MANRLPRFADTETDVKEAKPQLKQPRLYKVILLNDDYTPMEFVVEVLQRFFGMHEAAATQVMLQIHHQGRGVGGTYTKDVAETKMFQVNEYAKSREHPLQCSIEPE